MKHGILLVPLLCMSQTQIQYSLGQRGGFPSPQQTGKASIEGSVIDALTREPVKKASVTLSGQTGLAVTDASGRFAFRQLPAGRYFIQVRSEKYPVAQDAFDSQQQFSITLAAEEQKRDVNISLTPGASIRGHVVDEDGNPMARCAFTATRYIDTGTGSILQQFGFSQSDDKGDYRIPNLPRGKYYIEGRCNQSMPLPHAFVRRSSMMDVPTLTYPPLFYPGAADPASGVKVNAPPSADVSGIDFRMVSARGVTVRGHAGPGPDRNVEIILMPKDPVRRGWRAHGGRVNPSTGEFQIPNVLPGSYDLVATATDEGRSSFAKASVEVGTGPVDPIDLTLAAAPSVSGSISIEGEIKTPVNNARVVMNPLESQMMMGQPPQVEVQSDGSFVINSVMPGRWQLYVNGVPGYLKSVKQGDQDVTPWDLEIGSSPVQLKVVVATKYAQLEPALASSTEGGAPTSAILWSAGGDPNFQQNLSINSQARSVMRVPPGRYHVCAVASAQPWGWVQNRALRKLLESHCETVDASDEGPTRVQLTVIPIAELKQLLEKIEE